MPEKTPAPAQNSNLSVIEGRQTHAQSTDRFVREAKGIATGLSEKVEMAGPDVWESRAALLTTIGRCAALIDEITKYVDASEQEFVQHRVKVAEAIAAAE